MKKNSRQKKRDWKTFEPLSSCGKFNLSPPEKHKKRKEKKMKPKNLMKEIKITKIHKNNIKQNPWIKYCCGIRHKV